MRLKSLFQKRFMNIFLLKTVVFISSFLLFQIELIISKIFLPDFGGSYLVWGASLVFFQAILLAGYLYAFASTKKLGVLKNRLVQAVLLAIPLTIFFPGQNIQAISQSPHLPLVLDIFVKLFFSIGPVFFALSTLSVFAQSWLSQSDLPGHDNPYTLYGVSNLGSLTGLFTYPFLFKAYLGIDQQLTIWRLAYLVMVVLYTILLITLKTGKTIPAAKTAEKLEPVKGFYWFLLSCASVMMFMSVTNTITYEIAPLPLIWIIPLGIYLLAFVFNFKRKPWYPEWISEKFHACAGLSILLFFMASKLFFPFIFMSAFYCVLLFVICMFCQRQLYLSRPQNPAQLTLFYVFISLGGFAGGILTNWILPLIAPFTIEYLVALYFIALALAIITNNQKISGQDIRIIIYIILIMAFWPLYFKSYNFFGIILILYFIYAAYRIIKSNPKAFQLSILSILIMSPAITRFWQPQNQEQLLQTPRLLRYLSGLPRKPRHLSY
jgi:hypothetical protein